MTPIKVRLPTPSAVGGRAARPSLEIQGHARTAEGALGRDSCQRAVGLAGADGRSAVPHASNE